jgi:cobalamin biosynthesis Mg chelatase CobN
VPGITAVIRATSLSCQNAEKAQKFPPVRRSSGESRMKHAIIAIVAAIVLFLIGWLIGRRRY